MEASYRVRLDSTNQVADVVVAESCMGEMCSYVFTSSSLTTSSTVVSVDIVGCDTDWRSALNISNRESLHVDTHTFTHLTQLNSTQPIELKFNLTDNSLSYSLSLSHSLVLSLSFLLMQ